MTNNNDPLNQARFIYSVGKMLHDRMHEAAAGFFNNSGSAKEMVELSFPQTNMIMMIRNHRSITMSELANRLGVSPPSASAMVDRLVEKNFIVREHSTIDRRKVVVRISDSAKVIMDGIEEKMFGYVIDIVNKVGPETTGEWCRVLAKIQKALDAER